MRSIGLWTAFAIVGAAASAAVDEDPIPQRFVSCFGGEPTEPAGPGAPLGKGRVEEASRAFASASSYRACLSHISLFKGASWGTFEYVQPDRRRWRVRYRGRKDSDPTGVLEVVRIGAAWWLRSDGSWTRLPAGRKLQDAIPSPAWLPDPAELLKGFFEGSQAPSFAALGSAPAKAGTCEVWAKAAPPHGPSLQETVCVGSKDGLPHRTGAGGPAIGAYLQVELYDYAAPLEIHAPE